jgi:hypothetical protein
MRRQRATLVLALSIVMAGPAKGRDPAIHVRGAAKKGVDGRDGHGHDDRS